MGKRKKYSAYTEAKISVPRFQESEGFYTTHKSSIVMSKIRSKDTKVEVALRKVLWSKGFRYRLNKKNLPGKPDLVFANHSIVVFVDGDFWHGYNWQKKKIRLKSNKKYWIPKIERNIQRDKEITKTLINQGWKVLRFWEHEIEENIESCLEEIITALNEN